MDNNDLLVEVKNLQTYFYLDEGTVRAVDGADFNIRRGEILGVVGESGCGKSVTARSIIRIVAKPGRIVGGQILYHRRQNGNGQGEVIDLTQLSAQGDVMRNIRGAEISMVFQEPMTSLSPVHTIGNQIIEAITLHQRVDPQEARAKAIEMLDFVGMPLPDRTIEQYSYELSGGMRQRAMIAMALSCHPSLLIADEPTTALDVTTEAQILTLMRRLQRELGMAIMYITHNLGVVAQMTENVVVMYMGKVVEQADVDTIFHNSLHPYTQALLHSIPHMGTKSIERRRLASIKGMVPDPYALPRGCAFHPRCSDMRPGICDEIEPQMIEVAPGHRVRCDRAAGLA
ncbi:MAG: ABC transporter ATP-binding protein [Anaerolineae bacterium]|nr:ABC transporter ATP-binding protein [Anaerolineae bacterium]